MSERRRFIATAAGVVAAAAATALVETPAVIGSWDQVAQGVYVQALK